MVPNSQLIQICHGSDFVALCKAVETDATRTDATPVPDHLLDDPDSDEGFPPDLGFDNGMCEELITRFSNISSFRRKLTVINTAQISFFLLKEPKLDSCFFALEFVYDSKVMLVSNFYVSRSEACNTISYANRLA